MTPEQMPPVKQLPVKQIPPPEQMPQMIITESDAGFDFHELGLIWYGGPLALILTQKNHFKLRKIQKMREFFINEYGVFEIDSETEYRFGKQPISIYNSHGTRIPRKVVKLVKKHYRQGKNMEIRRDLELVYPQLKTKEFRNIYEIFHYLVGINEHRAIDIDTEKFLPFYRAYNPISIKRLNEVCQIGRKAIDSLHPSLKPPIPIVFAIVGGIIGLAVIQNGPKYMREFGSYFDDLAGNPPAVVEPVINATQSVDIVPPPDVVPAADLVGQFLLGIWNFIEPVHLISQLISFL